MIVGHLKRCLAGFLAMAIVLTSSSISYALEAMPTDGTDYVTNASAVVADYYDLTADQTAILTNAQIAGGETYTVTVPEVGENDISYDFDSKTIYANHPDPEGDEGWKAVTADIIVTENGQDVVKETVSLKDSDEEKWDVENTFTYSETDNYGVTVNYVYYKTITQAEQERVLAIPENLADGIQNLEDLLAVQGALGDVKTQMEGIVKNETMLSGLGLGTDYLERVKTAYDGLYNISENAKTLGEWIGEYDQAESKVAFLMNYAADVDAAVELTHAKLASVYTESDRSNLETVYNEAKNNEIYGNLVAPVLRSYIDSLDVLVAVKTDEKEAGKLTVAKDFTWAVLNTTIFNDEYIPNAEFEAAVDNILEIDGAAKEVSVEGNILAEVVTYAESIDVNSQKVYVTVQINVADTNKVNTGALRAIKALDRQALTLAEGLSEAEVNEAIEAAVNNADLSAWSEYGFDVDGIYSATETYTATTLSSNSIPSDWTLTEDLEYVLTYNPVNYTVKQDCISELGEKVPYGSKIVLPSAEKADESYDYTVVVSTGENSSVTEYYDQDAELTVKSDMTITRTKGGQKELVSLWSILADEENYSLTDEAREILKSTALNSPVVKIRYPGATEGQVTADEDGMHSLYAGAFDSGIAGMTWVPDVVTLYNDKNEQVGDDIEFYSVATLAAEGGVNYIASWDGDNVVYKSAEVNYKLVLTQISDGKGYRSITHSDVENGVNALVKLVPEVQKQNELLTGRSGVTARTIYEKLKNDDGSCKLNSTVLDILKNNMENTGISAVDGIKTNCWNNADSELKIFGYLRSCAPVATTENPDPDWNLGSIYRNGYYALIRQEAEKLAPYLRDIAEDTGFDDFITAIEGTVLSKEQAEEIRTYIKGSEDEESLADKFDKLVGENGIHDPHESLNVKDSGLDNLIKAIVALDADTVREISVPEDVVTYAYYAEIVAAPTTVVYSVEVKVGNKTAPIEKITIDLVNETSRIFTDADKGRIDEKIAVAKAILGITKDNEKYFDMTSNLSEFVVGETEVSGAKKITVTYEPKTYVVKIAGEDSQSFKYGESQEIILPECKDADETGNRPYYYQYQIGTETIDVNNTENMGGKPYEFNDLGLFDNETNTCVITREKIEKKWVDVDSFIKTMNAELSKKGLDNLIKFASVKSENANASNDQYDSIVMKINATTDVNTAGILEAVASAFGGLNYDYIGFKGDAEDASVIDFKYYDTNNDMKLNPQGLVDMILTSGTSTATFVAAIDANGNPTNNVPLNNGYAAVDGEKADIALGGTVVKSNILFGTGANNSYSIPMYVTLGGDDTGYLVQIRNLMNSLSQYVTFALTDNKVNFVGSVPENIYNIYLSFMILMDNNISLDSINDADLKTQLDEIMAMMEDILSSDSYDWKVVVNTLEKLGIDTTNIENQKDIITKLVNGSKKLYKKYKGAGEAGDPVFEKTGQSYVEFGISYDAKAALEKVDTYALIKDMLATTKLDIDFKFELINIKEAYEALVIDMGQSGLEKVNYTDDVVKALAEAKGLTYVVLLKDIENKGTTTRVLDIDQTTILNLNGHKVYANIAAEDGSVKIVNSVMDSTDPAVVYGSVSGNATLMAGYYFEKNIDKATMINSSYETTPEGNMVFVHNKYYTLEEDANGNLTVVLTTKFAEALHENVKDVAVEIASDLLFKAYTNSSVAVKVGDQTYDIYDFDFDNLLDYIENMSAAKDAVLEGIDEAGITKFVNILIGDFSNFGKIAEALTSDLTVASYNLETSKWYAKPYINEDEKAIALGINTGKEVNTATRTLTIKFAEANKELADSFKELDKIVTINPTFILESIDYTTANGFQLNGSAGAKIVMNMLSKDGTASDYVTTLAVLLAYNMENGKAKDDFLKAIEYYDGNVYAGYLKETFDTFTVGQLKAALEKAGKAESFAAVIKELGLEGTEVGNHAARLEACYKPLLDAFDEVYTEIVNIVGQDQIDELLKPQYDKTFASLKGAETGHYDAEFKNASGKLWFDITLKLFATAADDEEYVDNVQDFLDKFDAIPDYTNDKTTSLKDRASQSADAIREALEAYNKLSEEQKKIVAKQYAELQKLIESYEVKLGVWAEEITGKYIYKGSGHTPAVKVYFGATVLTAGKDYSVSYKYNVNAANANTKKAPQAIITLKGNYTGKIYKYFTIEKINLSGGAEYLKNLGLTISEVNQAKSKKANYSKPVITLNGKNVDASNFTFTYPTGTAHKKIGTYTVTITGKGKNFTGSTTVDLNVVTALLKNVTVEKKIKTQKYKDGGVKPGSSKFKLTYKGTTLVEGTHFEIVDYKNYDKAGTATVVLRGLGIDHKDAKGLCFAGTLELNYKIKALGSLKKVTLKTTKKTYTGSEITLTGYKVKGSNGKKLVEGKDYKVTYSNNVKAGKATITFTGIGGYTGSVKKTFTIAKKTLSSKYLTEGKDLVVKYTKGGVTPTSSIELTYKGKVLKNGTDYTIKWGNNTKVRKATSKKAPYFTITGKGNFKGSFTVKFTIQGTSIENTVISVKDVLYKNKKYNYKPSITVTDTNGKKLKSGTDYKVSYQILKDGKWQSVSKSNLYKSKRLKLNSKNPEAFMRVKITGKGNYAGAKVYKEYRMYYKSITKSTINVGDYTYSRYTSELRQTIENNLKVYYGKKLLKAGVDYDYEIVSIKNYENAGEATVVINGLNTYGGTLSKTFTIKAVKHSPVKLKKSMVAAESKKLVVDYKKDSAAKPSTKDIKLSYVDNNGETVNLVYGRDYTIKWYNTGKVAKSTAKKAPKFKITGKGNFTGSTTVKYTIQKSDVADLDVTAKNKKYESEKYNYKTKVTVKDVNGKALVAGKDYKVSYQVKKDGKWVSVSKSGLYKKSSKKIVLKKNTKSLEMRVVIKGKGSYTGKITDEYKLKR